MLRNLIIITLRNIKRQKGFSVLHVLGLSLGITCCLIVGLYAINEFGYDKFHTKAERIYRINQTFIWGDDDALFGSTGPAVAQAISAEVPEFEIVTRIHQPGSFLVSNETEFGNRVFDETSILAVDDSFFDVFTFPLVSGNPDYALSNPQSLVITERMAQKYFGDQQAFGQSLVLGEGENRKSYQITGVAKNLPSNSHITFDFLISMNSIPRVARASDSWIWTTFVTFGLLRPDANPALVAEKVAAVPGKYLEAFLQKYRGMSYEEFLASGDEWNLYMQPLLDIHLKSTHVYSRLNDINDIKMVYTLMLVAGFILILSLINFVNLSTARATARAKEVGVRKVIGSGKSLLIYQFLMESVMYAVVAACFALLLTELLLPLINPILNEELSLTTFINPLEVLGLFLGVLFIGVLGGVYPAFFLSSFRPIEALRKRGTSYLQGSALRNSLVTIQFAISIALLSCTLIIQDQVSFWNNLDLGFERENRIVISNAQRLGTNQDVFMNMLLANPAVSGVTESSDAPPQIFDSDGFGRKGSSHMNIDIHYVTADENFLEVFGLELVTGEYFRKGQKDSSLMIANRQLIKSFDLGSPEEAIGKQISYYENDFKIIGVIDDFQTLSDVPYPLGIFHENAPLWSNKNRQIIIAFNQSMSGNELASFIDGTRQQWASLAFGTPLIYSFLDEEYLRLFDSAITFGTILRGLTLLAVIIACLGLIGLVAYAIEKRNKEIGIRKVLGASATNIWLLLSGGFARFLIIGFSVAAPISWYMMSDWLEQYPVRKEISFVVILGSGILMMCIAAITMSFQTLRASQMNPVEYLSEE
ncbi:MAG: ABC transporter permease [Cyclobacteriaceae bacterium]